MHSLRHLGNQMYGGPVSLPNVTEFILGNLNYELICLITIRHAERMQSKRNERLQLAPRKIRDV